MNKAFAGLKQKLNAKRTKEQKMIEDCPEYQTRPAVGLQIFIATKGHPCSGCNRPKGCTAIIK